MSIIHCVVGETEAGGMAKRVKTKEKHGQEARRLLSDEEFRIHRIDAFGDAIGFESFGNDAIWEEDEDEDLFTEGYELARHREWRRSRKDDWIGFKEGDWP
jgi:hypothetical protein